MQTGTECLDVSLFARPAIEEGLRTDVSREREQLAELSRREIGLSHFLATKIAANAFDVDAKVFDPVKKLGATVVGAADETQLNNQLQFILQKKILLEEEEPAKK